MNLRQLLLNYNRISDVRPLTDLINLVNLSLVENPIKNRKPLFELLKKNPNVTIYLKNNEPFSQQAYMYWINTDNGTLHRLVGSSVEDIAPGVDNVVSLVVTDTRLYWVEDIGNNNGRLRRSALNGTNIQLIRDLTATPAGITVDTANNKIYLTNGWGKVQSINLDGSGYKPNLIRDLNDPKDIAVGAGKIYWITADNTVQSANVDGSGVRQIAGGYGTLGGIAVGTGKVFWTEKTSDSAGKIHSANLDGSHVEELISVLAVPYGISVDTVENKIYWTNSRGKILGSNIRGTYIQTVVTNLVSPGDVSVPSGTVAPFLLAPSSKYDVDRDGTVDNEFVTPEKTRLFTNYPNPFNPETWIPYQLATPSNVSISIYASDGKLIRTLDLGHKLVGIYQSRIRAAHWDGKNNLGEKVATGVYFVKFSAGDFTATRKMLIRK